MLILSRDCHSVLVHGFEGTDSTLLISTLAQLIMDPCCRTLEGFLALLEREWVQVSVHSNAALTVCKTDISAASILGYCESQWESRAGGVGAEQSFTSSVDTTKK